jgi:hypothetical protein
MILKSAQSYVLRIGLGITGVVPVDEMTGAPEPLSSVLAAQDDPAEVGDFDFSALAGGDELGGRAREAVRAMNALQPMSWPPARVEMTFAGMDEVDVLEQVQTLERQVEDLRAGGVQAPGEEDIADAEVVPDEERVAGMRARAGDLERQLEAAAPGSAAFDELSQELDLVQTQLAALEDPAQPSLEL